MAIFWKLTLTPQIVHTHQEYRGGPEGTTVAFRGIPDSLATTAPSQEPVPFFFLRFPECGLRHATLGDDGSVAPA